MSLPSNELGALDVLSGIGHSMNSLNEACYISCNMLFPCKSLDELQDLKLT